MLVAYCDTPDCDRSNNVGAEGTPGQSKTELRAEMRAAGWRRIDGKDYCPDCVRDRKASREQHGETK